MREQRICLEPTLGALRLELCDHDCLVRDLAFAPNGSLRLVSASDDGTLKVWDIDDDGNLYKTLRSKCTIIFGCSWSPDAKMLASVGNYKSVSAMSFLYAIHHIVFLLILFC